MLLSFIHGLQHFHTGYVEERDDLQFRRPTCGWENAIGHDRRIVKRWLAELETKKWIFDMGLDDRRQTYQIADNESTERRSKLSLDFVGMIDPALWRTWAVLRSYTGPKGYAYPNRMTLAGNLGLERAETVTRRIARLERMGLVERTRRGVGSNLYRVMAEYAPHSNVTSVAPKRHIDRTQTSHRAH